MTSVGHEVLSEREAPWSEGVGGQGGLPQSTLGRRLLWGLVVTDLSGRVWSLERFCGLVCVLPNLDAELEASVWLSDKLSLCSWSSNCNLLSAMWSTCSRLPDNLTWVKGKVGSRDTG